VVVVYGIVVARKQLAQKRLKDKHFRDFHLLMAVGTNVNILVKTVSISNNKPKSTLDT